MKFSFSSNGKHTSTRPRGLLGVILFALVFVVVGVGLLFYSYKSIKEYNVKNEKFTEIKATVVDYEENDDLYAVIVEYTVNGVTHKKTSNEFSNMPPSKGTQISIKYNADNPKEAIWTNDSINYVLPIMGVVFILAGVFVAVINVKNKKKLNNMSQAQPDNNNQSNNL